jgi:hypothetical protein
MKSNEAPQWCFESALGVLGFIADGKTNPEVLASLIYKHSRASQWQPISSAPKDGRTFLLGYPNQLGKWRTVRGQWFTNEEISEWENADDFEAGWYETSVENDELPNCWLISPTHWIPLPAPPQDSTSDVSGNEYRGTIARDDPK